MMVIHTTTVLEDVDGIVDSTDEQERRNRLEKFRTKLNGQAPSIVIKQFLSHPPVDDIDVLHHKIDLLLEDRALLEQQIAALNQQINRYAEAVELPKEGYYSMGYFLRKLMVKMRRSYGWRTDYLRATETSPNCTPVSNETVQKWQNSNRVPIWAVEQIDLLEFQKRNGRSGKVWTADNKEFLIKTFKTDPSLTNAQLAALCSKEFERPITENSIKGELDRSRKRKLLPEKRAPRRSQETVSGSRILD